MPEHFAGTVALVTGGQRGLGAAFTDELLHRGADRVYVTARAPRAAVDPRIHPLALDVTNADQVQALSELAPDVTMLINNAGVSHSGPLLAAPWEQITESFDTNTYGPLRVALAMAPVLAKAPRSQLVNIHSVLAWVAGAGAYGASKTALWSLTNQLRLELAAQGTTVTGVHLGLADTDMTARIQAPKLKPHDVATRVLNGVFAGEAEVLVDDDSKKIKAALSGPVEKLVLSLPRRAGAADTASRD